VEDDEDDADNSNNNSETRTGKDDSDDTVAVNVTVERAQARPPTGDQYNRCTLLDNNGEQCKNRQDQRDCVCQVFGCFELAPAAVDMWLRGRDLEEAARTMPVCRSHLNKLNKLHPLTNRVSGPHVLPPHIAFKKCVSCNKPWLEKEIVSKIVSVKQNRES
jgi:hypothetical protein